LSAVRSVERWARLRAVAERVFRMFFFADAMFGTKDPQKPVKSVELASVANPQSQPTKLRGAEGEVKL